jgi:transcriptional regulator with XRE-family HTH domain
MSNDFPRILTLLRKERHLSQKQAAADLHVAQALLSHYEKGKRECGLDFLVKVADYYHVSTDYLLGRSAVPDGSVLTESEIPEPDGKTQDNLGSFSAVLMKKLINSSIDITYSLLGKIGNPKLSESLSNLLALTVYHLFRIVYKTNPKNDDNLFGISDENALYLIAAGVAIAESKAVAAADPKLNQNTEEITTDYLDREYRKHAAALLNLIRNCENYLSKMNNI